jgi:hypothetical protein
MRWLLFGKVVNSSYLGDSDSSTCTFQAVGTLKGGLYCEALSTIEEIRLNQSASRNISPGPGVKLTTSTFIRLIRLTQRTFYNMVQLAFLRNWYCAVRWPVALL